MTFFGVSNLFKFTRTFTVNKKQFDSMRLYGEVVHLQFHLVSEKNNQNPSSRCIFNAPPF